MMGWIGAAIRGFIFGYLLFPGLYLVYCVCTSGATQAGWQLAFTEWKQTFFNLQTLFLQVGGVCAFLNVILTLFPRRHDYDVPETWLERLLDWLFFWLWFRK